MFSLRNMQICHNFIKWFFLLETVTQQSNCVSILMNLLLLKLCNNIPGDYAHDGANVAIFFFKNPSDNVHSISFSVNRDLNNDISSHNQEFERETPNKYSSFVINTSIGSRALFLMNFSMAALISASGGGGTFPLTHVFSGS